MDAEILLEEALPAPDPSASLLAEPLVLARARAAVVRPVAGSTALGKKEAQVPVRLPQVWGGPLHGHVHAQWLLGGGSG